MNRTKIEWTRGPSGEPGYSWNPLRGLCPENCKTPDGKSYCYARRMYQRFGWDEKIIYDYAPLEVYGKIKSGSRVFVCSTLELFNERVDHFRPSIFSTIESRPDLTFIILTKRPERIDCAMPDNVWLGVSVTQREDVTRLLYLRDAEATVKFISFEPILDIIPYFWPLAPAWVIAGRLTGHGKKHDPQRWQIEAVVEAARKSGVPIFLKNNLKDIWPGPLIQEFPKEV